MSDTPDLSVVMSVYNGARDLRETMDSVLAQEEVVLEFIVVNDGSTDESPHILDEYAKRDSRIKIIHQENQGLTRALINGCARASGAYIARQDVGDVSLPGRLSLQKTALETDTSLAFVSCWTEFYGPEWEFLYTVKGSGIAVSPTYILSEAEETGVTDGPTCHPSVMFRREVYLNAGGYRAQFYYGQDWDLWYRLAELGKFQLIKQPLYRVRVMPDGISMKNKAVQNLVARLSLSALQQRRQNLSDDNILEQAAAIRHDKSAAAGSDSKAPGFYFIGECLRRNGDWRSLNYFKSSIKESPLFLKPWIRILQNKLSLSFSRVKI